MTDLSMHILDIAENSINAGAKNIGIFINEDEKSNLLTIEITDDGKGMTKEETEAIQNPFVTSRTTRKVGLGIPLLKESAEIAGGRIEIHSGDGKGTKVKAYFEYNHIDRRPLGNIAETLISIILFSEDTGINYRHIKNGKEFEFNTNEIKSQLRVEKLNDIILLNQLKKILTEKISKT